MIEIEYRYSIYQNRVKDFYNEEVTIWVPYIIPILKIKTTKKINIIITDFKHRDYIISKRGNKDMKGYIINEIYKYIYTLQDAYKDDQNMNELLQYDGYTNTIGITQSNIDLILKDKNRY